MSTPPLRIGLFGIGLDAYWPQFAGLKERLEGYVGRVAGKLARPGVEVVNLGLVDNPERAYAAGHEFRRADVDLIFLHVTTYALSSTVLPVVLRAKVPVVILNLQPAPAIDYPIFNRMDDRTKMTGEWLAHCAACPVPEIANVFKRAGIRFHQVTGMLDDDPTCWREVDAWVEAARVTAGMYGNRLGLMGHYYSGMLDIYSDTTLQCATFGTHIEILEVDELSALRREVTDAQVKARVADFHREFDVQADCAAPDLAEAARTSVALDALVAKRQRPLVGDEVRVARRRDPLVGIGDEAARGIALLGQGVDRQVAGPVVAGVPTRRRRQALQVVVGSAQRHPSWRDQRDVARIIGHRHVLLRHLPAC